MNGRRVIRQPVGGDVLHLTRSASPQFVKPLIFRVIRLHDWTTYQGWIWLDGYQLASNGDAVERRSVFVMVTGLSYLTKPQRRGVARQPVSRGVVRS